MAENEESNLGDGVGTAGGERKPEKQVLLHNPAEFPEIGNQFFHVPMNQTVTVAVRPNMMTTSKGLKNYEPKRRQCFYQSDRQLRFFRVYTQSNCNFECLTNYTFSSCGCVSFYMPRGPDMEVCGSGSRNCTERAQDYVMVTDLKAFSLDSEHQSNATSVDCNCLPACTELKYDVDVSQTDFSWVQYYAARGEKMHLSKHEGNSQSSLRILFKDSQFIASHRSELYGSTDFLANCGGLLGLFMGFSILSLVEVVYYCTLRVCCNLLKRRSRDFQVHAHMEGRY